VSYQSPKPLLTNRLPRTSQQHNATTAQRTSQQQAKINNHRTHPCITIRRDGLGPIELILPRGGRPC
jgi:hypothetical protein